MIDVYSFLKKSVRFELVYTNNNGKTFSFDTEIKEVFDDKVLVEYPRSKEYNFSDIEIFARLNAVVYTDSGVLTSNVNLLKKDYGEFKDVFISFPYNNQFCQRREDTRIPMHVDFELNVQNANMYALKTKNISGKGIACITPEPLVAFDNAEITLHMPNADITALCRKVYSKEIEFNGNVSFVNGIAFTEISQDNVNTIIKETLRFQLDSKRNERLFETL